MKVFVVTLLIVSLAAGAIGGTARYVSPSGSDSNPGTFAAPYKTLSKGVSSSSAGDTVWVRGGTYAVSSNISVSKTGSAGNYLRIWAYPGEQPLFDFSAQTSSDGISLKGTYTHLRGLEITHAFHNGINVSGHYNIIENCKVHDNRNSGVQMGSSSSTANPSNNLFLNIDSYLNYDAPIGGNADGFAIKWNIGTGNVFRGCRAYNNSDDGWDLWMAINPVEIDSSMAFRNAVDAWHQAGFNGNGNGFKLGGNYVATSHIVKNCVAFDNTGNTGRGFDENNNTAGQTLYNCTSYRNKGDNYHFTNTLVSGTHTIKNCLSYLGGVAISSATLQTNSWQGFTIGAGDFVSFDTAQAVLPRAAEGALQTITLLHLVHSSSLVNAGTDVGTPYLGSAPDLGAYETSELPQYALTTSAVNGSIAKSPSALVYDSASSVQLTAVPNPGYEFTGWSGDLSGTANPAVLVMSSAKSVTASFALIQYQISATAGPNGSITPSGTFMEPEGDSIRFAIEAASGYHVDSVLVDGVDQGQIFTYLFSNIQATHMIVAKFAQNPPSSYVLTVSGTHGTVSRAPDSQYYLSGANVQLTAIPEYGYHFLNWTGDVTGSANPNAITMDADKSVTAVFAIDSFAVNVAVDGSGSVSKSPDLSAYPYNSMVTLTPQPAVGQHFVAWIGDVSGADDPLELTVDTVKNITAVFATNAYPVVATVSGGGSVSRTPNQSTVFHGGTIQLTAIPQTGWVFNGWSGDTVTTANPVSFTVTDTIHVTAIFVVQTFGINAVSGEHGSISPSGTVSVNYGSTQRFTFVPANGYIIDTLLIDGVQNVDSTTGYTFANITSPHSISVTFTATDAMVSLIAGWNLVSLPVDVPDKRVSRVFTAAISTAYSYQGSYVGADSLALGAGYWVKFAAPELHAFNGPEVSSLQVRLRKGWNIIGSLTGDANVSGVTSNPPGLLTSPWYAYNGAYYQSDLIHPGMAYWVKASDSGTVTITTLSASPRTGAIVIDRSTELPPPPPGAVSGVAAVPSAVELSANYPNPFNPLTMIRFGLPAASSVRLTVYSMLGQEVSVLVNETLPGGYHEVRWNGTTVNGSRAASGVYNYVLRASDDLTGTTSILTGRMILAQ